MGEYFIGSDGELYHWGWKKKDAKYTKREWKSGKWVYTYPDDSKGKQSATSNTSASKGVKSVGGAAAGTQKGALNTASNKGVKSIGAAATAKDSVNYYTDDVKRKISNIKNQIDGVKSELFDGERRSNKAENAKDYAEYKEYYKKERASIESKITDWPINSAVEELVNWQEKPKNYSEQNLGKTLFDAAKDWFGIDEKERYYSIERQIRNTQERLDDSSEKLDYGYDRLVKLENDSKSGEERVSYDDLARACDGYLTPLYWYKVRDREMTALKTARSEAEEAYRKTPAYKVDKFIDSVDNVIDNIGDGVEAGRDWLDDRIDDVEDWFRKLKRR